MTTPTPDDQAAAGDDRDVIDPAADVIDPDEFDDADDGGA